MVIMKRGFIEECINKTQELITSERLYHSNLPFYIEGVVSADNKIPHGSDSDYRMRFDLNSSGRKFHVRGPLTLPNDEEETRDGPAYVSKRVAQYLEDLKIMKTLFKLTCTSPYKFEINDRK